MSIAVRAATAADCPAMGAIWKQLDRDFLDATPPGFGAPMRAPDDDDGWQARWLVKALAEPDRIGLVAVRDATVLGFALAEVKRVTDDFFFAPYLNVDHLQVTRNERRAGIGRALLVRMEVIARERSCTAIDLDVSVLNAAALGLYASHGFTPLTQRMAKRLDDQS